MKPPTECRSVSRRDQPVHEDRERGACRDPQRRGQVAGADVDGHEQGAGYGRVQHPARAAEQPEQRRRRLRRVTSRGRAAVCRITPPKMPGVASGRLRHLPAARARRPRGPSRPASNTYLPCLGDLGAAGERVQRIRSRARPPPGPSAPPAPAAPRRAGAVRADPAEASDARRGRPRCPRRRPRVPSPAPDGRRQAR